MVFVFSSYRPVFVHMIFLLAERDVLLNRVNCMEKVPSQVVPRAMDTTNTSGDETNANQCRRRVRY